MFHRGGYAQAVELMLPVRVDLGQIDGVRAQRDLVDWTLTEVAAGQRANCAIAAARRCRRGRNSEFRRG